MIRLRKYSNRKIYSVDSSGYVTLPQIAELIRQGNKIQVVDVRTKQDITNVVLHKVLTYAKLNQDKIYNLIQTQGE